MLAGEQTNLQLKIIGITYRNSETGYSVLKAKIEKSQEIVCVTATTPDLQPNTLYEAKGQWIEHKQYGRQFQASLLVAQTPQDRYAILAYLSSGNIEGIGEKTAKAIVQKFGDKTLEILDKHPEQLLNVAKIGRKKLKLIRDSWREQTSQRDLVIFLQSHAVPLRFMTKLIQTYGASAKIKIENEPYDLINDIPGIGFILADRIAQKNGLQADAVARIEAATYYLINEYNSRGHCFISTSQLLIALGKLLNIDELIISERLAVALNKLNHELKIVTESLPSQKEGENALVHWKKEIYFAEQSLSNSINSLLKSSVPKINENEFNDKILALTASDNKQVELSADQLQAIYLALNSKIFILTGGPGVGKTTTANLIIKYFSFLQKKICVCAPTGRAAQRLSELTALNATTIQNG
ncbi:MAG: AAA family ATPase, partial [Oligoflexales bacterium]|nr:AAA family ATPase [Oligoflexales bacterium]